MLTDTKTLLNTCQKSALSENRKSYDIKRLFFMGTRRVLFQVFLGEYKMRLEAARVSEAVPFILTSLASILWTRTKYGICF
ncbi:hypothetical protein CEXT_733241 [Caerostris extrusa]|uniref:Uncharacterized protein n=1 Tax=Caerostris extrusa TaxID=172846 RepID=A0AAV4R0X1_CAEEX|nr:hypothetical protein CEXT_733241 [Caerostris extrusa]